MSQEGTDAEQAAHRLKSARVTVLFADVVGFTPMAENLPAALPPPIRGRSLRSSE